MKDIIITFVMIVFIIAVGIFSFTGDNPESFNSQSQTISEKSVTVINGLNP